MADADSEEAQAAEPGEIVYAAGARWRKQPDGTLERIDEERGPDDAEHD